jgi:hypothetical protein
LVLFIVPILVFLGIRDRNNTSAEDLQQISGNL